MQIEKKSRKGNPKCWLWFLTDVDGEFKAVCFEVSSLQEALRLEAFGKAAGRARATFAKTYGVTVPRGDGLILPPGAL